jgi:hypothetical protein
VMERPLAYQCRRLDIRRPKRYDKATLSLASMQARIDDLEAKLGAALKQLDALEPPQQSPCPECDKPMMIGYDRDLFTKKLYRYEECRACDILVEYK